MSNKSKKSKLENDPRSVHIFISDLQRSESLESEYGINRSYIARLGLRIVIWIMMSFIQKYSKNLNPESLELEKEQCSIRYSIKEVSDAEFVRKELGCDFSDLGRWGYHLGVLYLEYKKTEDSHEREVTGGLEQLFELYSRELQQQKK